MALTVTNILKTHFSGAHGISPVAKKPIDKHIAHGISPVAKKPIDKRIAHGISPVAKKPIDKRIAHVISPVAKKPIENRTAAVWNNAEIYTSYPSKNIAPGAFVIKENTKAARVFKKAMSSQHIRQLYNEAVKVNAQNGGTWGIRFVNKPQFDGTCDYTNREIVLSDDISEDKAMSIFVFELTNCISQKRFDKVYKEACQLKIGRDEYAKTFEKIEHEGTMKHHQVMSAAIKEKGWRKDLDLYANHPKSFEAAWRYLKDSAHTNYYRKHWETITAFFKNNYQFLRNRMFT